MSYCRSEGKDQIIFVTKEDHETPSKASIGPGLLEEEHPGLILASGEINWNCPCLGGMATGPCGVQFREAFTCFHYSTADPKGSNCFDQFRNMQECMSRYPGLYPQGSSNDDNDDPIVKTEENVKENNSTNVPITSASTDSQMIADKN